MEPLPGGVPTVAGRTPIACQNCANAKTGCDKRVPCSRCAEKNLPCAARFARRSSKAAARAAQASAALSTQLVSGVPRAQSCSISPSMMDIDHGMTHATSVVTGSPERDPGTAVDYKMQSSTQPKPTPDHHFSPPEFPSPHSKLDMMSDFMHIGNDFVAPESGYSDLYVWPDYSLDLAPDLYSNPLTLRPELAMPTFSEFSDISSGSEPMTATPSAVSMHTRGTSITSATDFESIKTNDMTMCAPNGTMMPEFEVVIAAENSWPLARCNKPRFSSNCPRTAIVHLEALEQKCKQDGTWDALDEYLMKCDKSESPRPTVIPITSRTRDKMTAITQSFLHKALDVHRGGSNGYGQTGSYSNPGNVFNFIMLPPNNVLEYFLGSYVRSLLDYYPLAPAMRVDPNEMLQNNQASTLLVLLMIAQGAATVPNEEARYLSAGLTETSRISLFNIIEKNVELSADPTALRCALLFTLLGAWSGDKWQMDIAMGQRGMYLSVSQICHMSCTNNVLTRLDDETRGHAGTSALDDPSLQRLNHHRTSVEGVAAEGITKPVCCACCLR